MASTLSDRPFLTLEQRAYLYDNMIKEIEKNDVEGIVARDAFKAVPWHQYVEYRRAAFIESQSWQELASAVSAFSSGFVNLHSRFRFNAELKTPKLLANRKIAYTYPEIAFFLDDENQSNIKRFNDKSAAELFSKFENQQCQYIFRVGCLSAFVEAFERGELLVDGNKIKRIVSDEQTYKVIHTLDSSKPESNYLKPIQEQSLHDWQTLKLGYKVAMYKTKGFVLLKIKDFVYPKGRGGDFRCSDSTAEDKTMCADILLVREVLSGAKANNTTLLINVMNNGGGSESTPFIAELVGAPFEDLRVAFRNSEHLLNDDLRKHLFYRSSRAKEWFSTLKPGLPYGDFLPIRADFCRGGQQCELEQIKPNNQRQFQHTYILANENCISSCDDFVWRMQEFGGARVVGLPHSTDATYGRISIQYFLDAENKISKTFYGDGMQPEFEGVGVFSVTVPFSQTVDSNGQSRLGKHAPYEFIFPVSRENFNNYETALIDKLIR